MNSVFAAVFAIAVHGQQDLRSDYPKALAEALEAKKLLVVEFGKCIDVAAITPEKRKSFVWCQVPLDYRCRLENDKEDRPLRERPGFSHVGEDRGIVLVEGRDVPERGNVVSVLTPSYFKAGGFLELLDLPIGSLESRTLVWAVRRHPGKPASAWGTQSARLHDYAMRWARHQAEINKQYHSDILAGGVRSENVAETFDHYPGLLEGAEQLVYMWSQSEGHWKNMSTQWKAFGYGMAWSPKGNCWFGCQVFDDAP